ncbi:MAG: S-layer homology domain-containing protein [Lachnospiraceae bacterium]|nr:S-layer homology domain-containing protein [Lachnospiraceae bacterium]
MKIKRYIALALSLVMVFMLSGCIKEFSVVTMNNDGTGELTVDAYMDKDLLGDTLEETDYEGIEIVNIDGKDWVKYSLTYKFNNAETLGMILNTLQFSDNYKIKAEQFNKNGTDLLSIEIAVDERDTSNETTIELDDLDEQLMTDMELGNIEEQMMEGMECVMTFRLPSDKFEYQSNSGAITIKDNDVVIDLFKIEPGEKASILAVLSDSPKYKDFAVKTKTYDNNFEDVSARAWYRDDVINAYELGIINGISETKFNPDGNITLAEIIKIASVVRSLYYNDNYDFSADGYETWYEPYVEYALETGVIQLDDFSEYTDTATREQVAYILKNSLPGSEFTALNDNFEIPDLDVEGIYNEFITNLYKSGVLTGSDSHRTFNPHNEITRAEVSAILNRVIYKDARIKF